MRRDVQGLRALAVVAVVLSHALGWPSGGFVGVDVFFVVSGFLITGLLLREIAQTGRVSLAGFYARRIRRILPAALLVLVVVAIAGFFVFNRARADQTLWDAIAAFALVSNWRFAAEGTDYFGGVDVSPLQHFWSLSVEEQYYLVWPGLLLLIVLCLPLAARRGAGGRAAIGIAALAVVGASAAWAWMQTPAEPTVAYFSTATRAWELGVGALLAVAAPVLSRLPAVIRWPLGWVGLAGVVWSFFAIDPASPFPAPWAALPVAATALVLAGGVGGDPRQRHLFPLTNPVSVFVGDVSYSLYLWHFPVIIFAGMLLPPGDVTTGIVFAVIAILTLVSYFGLEQPLHRSPWLRGRGGRTASSTPSAPEAVVGPEPAAPAPTPPAAAPTPAAPAPAAPAVARVVSRPAGWVPGQRYYPGSRPRPAAPGPASGSPAALEAAAAQPSIGPTAQHPEPAAAASAPVAPTPAAHDAPRGAGVGSWTAGAGPRTVAAAPAATEPAPSERPWAQWWGRFRAQIALAGTGLALGAGATVLALMAVFGSPVLGPTAPPAAAGEQPIGDDPTAAIQAELASAVASSEWPALHPSLDEVMIRSSANNPAHDCFAPESTPDAGRCTWGSGDAPRHMYLVGDSSAMAYAPAFKKIAEDSGGAWRVTTVGMYGCRFTDVLIENRDPAVMAGCTQRKLDVGAMIAAQPADLVVVSNAYTLGHSTSGRDLSASDLIASSATEMATYGVAGRVVYLAPPPHGADLSRCYSPLNGPAACLSTVDGVWFDMQAAAEATAAASGDHAISSLSFSCWQDVCPAFAGDLPIRYDENHLTTAYSEHIAPLLRWTLGSLGLY